MNHPVDSWEYIKQHKSYYTFRFTGITFAFAMILSSLFSGCEPPRPFKTAPPPKPKIRIEQSETNSTNSLRVLYENHKWERNRDRDWVGNPHVDLRTLEDIKDYKKEVEFLLKELDQAEKKMEIHSDGPKTISP